MRRLAWVLGLAAVATQISYPLTTGAGRDEISIAVVLLLAAACALHAAATRGLRWTAALLLVTTGGGLLVEAVGTATGMPFGSYTYADARLGPVVAGVPLIIGLAWTAGTYPAWCAGERVAHGRARQILLAATGLAGWDLYLDPQMVADGRWHWAPGSAALPGVPEVPLSNYLGWAATALVMMLVLHLLSGPDRDHADALPLGLFLWTWLGSALAQAVFLNLRVSAGYGLVAMAVLGVPLLWNLRRAGWATAASAVRSLARWAGASGGEQARASSAVSGAGDGAAHRGSVAERVLARAHDHGNFRR